MRGLRRYDADAISVAVETAPALRPNLEHRQIGRGELMPVGNRRRQTEIVEADTTLIRATTEHLEAERGKMEAMQGWARTYAGFDMLPEVIAHDRAQIRHQIRMDRQRWNQEIEEQSQRMQASFDRDMQEVRTEVAKLKAEEAGWKYQEARHEVQAEDIMPTTISFEREIPELGDLLDELEQLDGDTQQKRAFALKLERLVEQQLLRNN